MHSEDKKEDHLISGIDYSKIAHFCWKIKVIHGNDFLNATLRKHPIIKNALLNYEKNRIIELEREITNSIS